MFNKLIASILPYFPKKLIWIFSRSYISGETIGDAIRVSKELNLDNTKVTFDVLGEFITSPREAELNKNEYLNLIDSSVKNNIDGNFSLKPSSFGMLFDKETCYLHIRDILIKAASYNKFVRIDMEDSQCTSMEIELFRRLKTEFPLNVGIVVQAYLKRTMNDLESMLNMNSPDVPLNYRLCKGIYVEPESISYKKYEEINLHYLEDLEFMFKNNIYAAIATHDKRLIIGAKNLIDKYNIKNDMFEFQMLYGVTPGLRKKLVKEGYNMRVYVPYGEQWFGYSTRRLKENPKIASHIIKAIFYKG
jgi:proline dehydrogenase